MSQGECSAKVPVIARSKVVQAEGVGCGARFPGFESQLTLLPSWVTLDKLLILSVPQCFHSSAYLRVLLGKLFPSSRLSCLAGLIGNDIDTKQINGKNI